MCCVYALSDFCCTPWTAACHFVGGTSPGRNTGRLPFSTSGDINQKIELASLASAGGFFTTQPPGKPYRVNKLDKKLITVSLTKDQWIIVCFQQGYLEKDTVLCHDKEHNLKHVIRKHEYHGRWRQYFRIIFISQDSFIHWNLPKDTWHQTQHVSSSCLNFVLSRSNCGHPAYHLGANLGIYSPVLVKCWYFIKSHQCVEHFELFFENLKPPWPVPKPRKIFVLWSLFFSHGSFRFEKIMIWRTETTNCYLPLFLEKMFV